MSTQTISSEERIPLLKALHSFENRFEGHTAWKILPCAPSPRL